MPKPDEPIETRGQDAPGQGFTGLDGAWPERVRREGKRVRTAFRVRYAETDQMGMAYYANYLVWFEVMRGDYMRAVGVPYTRLEAEGYRLPIVEARVRYIAPAGYDDPVEVVAWISRMGSRLITFEYRVEMQGKLLATGETTHCPMGRDGRVRAFSRELLGALEPMISGE
jgi:acyl-CoA thioester hydrolase